MGSVYTYKDTSGFYTRGPLIYASPSVFEGMKADCSAVSRLARLGLLILLLAFLLHLIGFTTPAWFLPDPTFTDTFLGLHVTGLGIWEVCGTQDYTSFCIFLQNRDDWRYSVYVRAGWHYAVQVLVVLGFISSILPLALLILYMIRRNLTRRRTILIVTIAFSLLSGILILAAIIVYGMNMTEDGGDLSWSFGLTAAAGTLFILGTIPLFVDLFLRDKAHVERLP